MPHDTTIHRFCLAYVAVALQRMKDLGLDPQLAKS